MKIFGLILTLCLNSFAYSSEIIVSNNIEVLAINGIKTENTLFDKNKIELKNGTHQLVVKYRNKFRNGDTLETTPYIFDIEVDGITNLTTDRFTTYAQAKSSMKKYIAWHVENQKRQYTIKDSEKLKGKGFMPYRNIELLVREYNKINKIENIEPINQKILNDKTAKNYLIEQYKAASQEQKKQFKTWFIQH